MPQRRHKKGSSEGGKFAPDTSGKRPPANGSVSVVELGFKRTCQKCRQTFTSQNHAWAQVCPGCRAESPVVDVYSEFTRKVSPINLLGAPNEDEDGPEESEQDKSPMLDEFDGDENFNQDLSSFKGLGRFDYNFTEGEHYEVSREPGLGNEFRSLTDVGRKEFAKLVRRLGPPLDWPDSLKSFFEENEIPESVIPKGRSSMEFHMVSILASHPEYAFHRDDLTEIRKAYSDWYKRRPNVKPRPSGLKGTGDPIQNVNKTGQWGLVHQSVRLGENRQHYYTLREPYEFDSLARKLQEAIPLNSEDRDAYIERVQEFVNRRYSAPPEDWDQGHANPNDPSATIWQPKSLNRSHRNRFIFDKFGMVLCPTVSEIKNNVDSYFSTPAEKKELAIFMVSEIIRNAGEHYSPTERESLLAALKNLPSAQN